jgi:hypothetical protein
MIIALLKLSVKCGDEDALTQELAPEGAGILPLRLRPP